MEIWFVMKFTFKSKYKNHKQNKPEIWFVRTIAKGISLYLGNGYDKYGLLDRGLNTKQADKISAGYCIPSYSNLFNSDNRFEVEDRQH